MIEHDGHLPADILLRERPKTASSIGRERKIHDPLAGIVGVAIFRGAAKIAARDDRRAGQDVPTLRLLAERLESLRASGRPGTSSVPAGNTPPCLLNASVSDV